jgi:hypothetical protein
MDKQASVKDSLDLINKMLTPIRDRANKYAADSLNEDGGRASDSSTSFQDSSANTIVNHEKEDAVNSQTNLGTEQSQDAKDGGSTVDDEGDNANDLGDSFADGQGPQTLGTDDEVKDKGDIGPLARQEISQEQKLARAQYLGNAILDVISNSIGKTAMQEDAPEGGVAPKKGYPAANYQANVQTDPKLEDGGDISEKNASHQKTAEELAFDKLASIANGAAQEYYEGYMMGLLKRAQDEHEVLNSGIPMNVIQKAGGVSAILDKVAMEFPEAVMPEGEMPPMEGGDLGMAEGGEMPPMEGDPMMGEDPMAGELPMEGGEGMEDAGMQADPAGGDLEALVTQLEEAGVTPEELEQAFADVDELQQAGVAPEELAAALSEINDEGAMAPEGGMDMGMAEGEEYKEASARKRIDGIKAHFKRIR